VAAHGIALLGETAIPPGPGALLRALRRRRGLSLAQTARRLGLHPSSVSRWERSEMLPAAGHLEALLDCLDARAEEQIALRGAWAGTGPLAAWAPGEAPLTLDTLQAEFERLRRHEMWEGAGALMDLRFVSLEAQLWAAAARAAVQRLLGQACAYHAFWLS